MSICITIIPPAHVLEAIRVACRPYMQDLVGSEEHTWHMPLTTTSSMPSQEPLRQSFHQTLRILSIGEGQEKGRLWARIQTTQSLLSLRESVLERIGTYTIDPNLFTPHIYLGSFEKVPAFGIIDTPLTSTFSIREISVIQTDPYEILGNIPLTS